jgi:hypothetical protein
MQFKNNILSAITTCDVVKTYCFGGMYCLHLQGLRGELYLLLTPFRLFALWPSNRRTSTRRHGVKSQKPVHFSKITLCRRIPMFHKKVLPPSLWYTHISACCLFLTFLVHSLLPGSEDRGKIYSETLVNFYQTHNVISHNENSWVRERTIPTVRPPLVSEVSANFCG